jgi:hypothetical protein
MQLGNKEIRYSNVIGSGKDGATNPNLLSSNSQFGQMQISGRGLSAKGHREVRDFGRMTGVSLRESQILSINCHDHVPNLELTCSCYAREKKSSDQSGNTAS